MQKTAPARVLRYFRRRVESRTRNAGGAMNRKRKAAVVHKTYNTTNNTYNNPTTNNIQNYYAAAPPPAAVLRQQQSLNFLPEPHLHLSLGRCLAFFLCCLSFALALLALRCLLPAMVPARSAQHVPVQAYGTRGGALRAGRASERNT